MIVGENRDHRAEGRVNNPELFGWERQGNDGASVGRGWACGSLLATERFLQPRQAQASSLYRDQPVSRLGGGLLHCDGADCISRTVEWWGQRKKLRSRGGGGDRGSQRSSPGPRIDGAQALRKGPLIGGMLVGRYRSRADTNFVAFLLRRSKCLCLGREN
jgi:hypothetical protein